MINEWILEIFRAYCMADIFRLSRTFCENGEKFPERVRNAASESEFSSKMANARWKSSRGAYGSKISLKMRRIFRSTLSIFRFALAKSKKTLRIFGEKTLLSNKISTCERCKQTIFRSRTLNLREKPVDYRIAGNFMFCSKAALVVTFLQSHFGLSKNNLITKSFCSSNRSLLKHCLGRAMSLLWNRLRQVK